VRRIIHRASPFVAGLQAAPHALKRMRQSQIRWTAGR
jgi:hypothetical protein